MRSGTPAWIHALAAVTAAATLVATIDAIAAPRRAPEHEPAAPAPTSVDMELDPFTSTASEVAQWRESGRRVWCLLQVTTWEPDRPDADRFDAALLGEPISGKALARRLDLRRWDQLAPIIDDRLALCNAKGFIGVVIDEIDGSTDVNLADGVRASFMDRVQVLAAQRGLAVRRGRG